MKEEVFYKHGRRNSFHKDYTVCGKVVAVHGAISADGHAYKDYELHIGVSVCHHEDTFTKKVGTKLAYHLASEYPIVKIALKGDRSYMQYKAFVDSFVPAQALNSTVAVDLVVGHY